MIGARTRTIEVRSGSRERLAIGLAAAISRTLMTVPMLTTSQN